ncbi:hypothetical protein DV714_11430 [Parageobacillus thermoglucosidasius]|nr:hypothetical protein DV714_11430 [Parageobacillus thermoglucosidasius]
MPDKFLSITSRSTASILINGMASNAFFRRSKEKRAGATSLTSLFVDKRGGISLWFGDLSIHFKSFSTNKVKKKRSDPIFVN